MKFLFICHGNICRSPFAEVLFRSLVSSHQDWDVRSAGVGVRHEGRGAARKARQAAEYLGLSLMKHKTLLATKDIIMEADVIYYMDEGNRKRLDALLLGETKPPRLIALGPLIELKKIRDPNYTSSSILVREMYTELEQAVRVAANIDWI